MRRFTKLAVATGFTLAAACGGSSSDDLSTPTARPSSTSTTAPSIEPTSGPSASAEIVSEDGLATLRLPEGALPVGVSSEDIKVVPLNPADFDGGEGVEAIAVYELLPDGLVRAATG